MDEKVFVSLLILPLVMVIVVVALYLRYRKHQMFHKERITAMEKGIPVPNSYAPAPWLPRVYLLRGLLWAFGGLAISVFLLGMALSTQRPRTIEDTLWRARSLANSTGISLDEAKKIIEQDPTPRQNGMPLGMALLGLIPVSVGVA